MDVIASLKKATDSVPWRQIKTGQISPFTQHSPTKGDNRPILWFKHVLSDLYCFLIEDQNQSSANLFSGLRSGGWRDEKQRSY